MRSSGFFLYLSTLLVLLFHASLSFCVLSVHLLGNTVLLAFLFVFPLLGWERYPLDVLNQRVKNTQQQQLNFIHDTVPQKVPLLCKSSNNRHTTPDQHGLAKPSYDSCTAPEDNHTHNAQICLQGRLHRESNSKHMLHTHSNQIVRDQKPTCSVCPPRFQKI